MSHSENMKRRNRILLKSSIGLVLSTIAMYVLAPFVTFYFVSDRRIDFDKEWRAEDYGIKAGIVELQTDDGLNIVAWEVVPDTIDGVLIAITGIDGPSATYYMGHAKFLQKHNYATIMVELRAHGRSEGDIIGLGYKEYKEIQATVDYIKSKEYYADVPIVLMGVSMGGSSAINAFARIKDIDGLVAISSYASFEDMVIYHASNYIPQFLAETLEPMFKWGVKVKYDEDAEEMSPKEAIKRVGNRQVILMHCTEDPIVPFFNFEKIMGNAPQGVDSFVRKGNNHMFVSDHENIEKDLPYAQTIIDFINRID